MGRPALARQGRAGAFSLLAALCLVLAAMLPARAADNALFEPIGYSDNFRYFAFEQFGVQDGSGFPYSDIVLIDLVTDSYVGGAPFRARIDDEAASLEYARDTARQRAQAALDEYGIDSPARIVALLGDGEWGTDDTRMRFGLPSYGLTPPEGSYEIAIEEFRAPTMLDCEEWFGEKPMGFALTLDDGTGPRELHRDTRVPGSRNCVITYKAYAVVSPLWATPDIDTTVAIISVHSWGFEGADRRFIALPLGSFD